MANLTEGLIVEVKVKVSATVLLAGWSFPTTRVKDRRAHLQTEHRRHWRYGIRPRLDLCSSIRAKAAASTLAAGKPVSTHIVSASRNPTRVWGKGAGQAKQVHRTQAYRGVTPPRVAVVLH
jgi:hypothetical protein